MIHRVHFFLPALLLAGTNFAFAADKILFDFEDAADVKGWSNLDLGDPKTKEPTAKWELSTDHATSGKQSLKLTFAGGNWPSITTTQIPDDWMPFQTFKADVTVERPCLVGFCVMQEGSERGNGYDKAVSRWVKTQFMNPGKNSVTADLHPNSWSAIGKKFGKDKELGKVVRFEIFMYQPRDGESIYVDNVRLGSEKLPAVVVKNQFKVLGTDLVVADVRELGKKLADQWVKPADQTATQVEANFKTKFEDLKKKHPRVVLAVFREGAKGFDPKNPDKMYSGWQDAYWSSHGPDGLNVERATNFGKSGKQEIFMRHRSPLMRVDLSSIPKESNILAATFLVVRAATPEKARSPYQPNMWVAEACNRPWKEYEVNAFEYAKGKFWKAVGGTYYGDDPDFLPLYLAHGPSQEGCSTWDFTHAVRFWTSGKQENRGFMLHGDAADWFIAWYREAEEIKNRPAMMVIYEPKE
ncbi:MAG: DNRLRE domain-containing protein [Planctomycetes bacterium]|nr:DNRLRE domain-containing protein [Planctomycetota bacterium]